MQNQPSQSEKFLNMKQLSADTGIGINTIKKFRAEPDAPFFKTGSSRRSDVVTTRSEFESWLKSYSAKIKSA